MLHEFCKTRTKNLTNQLSSKIYFNRKIKNITKFLVLFIFKLKKKYFYFKVVLLYYYILMILELFK